MYHPQNEPHNPSETTHEPLIRLAYVTLRQAGTEALIRHTADHVFKTGAVLTD